MGITEEEKEKLKALCKEFGIADSIIDDEIPYRQNHLMIMKAAFEKIANLAQEEKTYELKISSYLQKEFGKIIVPKVAKDVIDRLIQVGSLLESTIEKVESEMTKIEKEKNEIETTPDILTKLERLKMHERELEMMELHLEFVDHLLEEARWLEGLLKDYAQVRMD